MKQIAAKVTIYDEPISKSELMIVYNSSRMSCPSASVNDGSRGFYAQASNQAAMYEAMANFGGGPPDREHYELYSKWASGGWGMIITGNVQVSRSHLSLGRDVTLPTNAAEMENFKQWARCIKSSPARANSVAIMQLNHAGRQSPRFIGGRNPWTSPAAPSPSPMTPREGLLSYIVFSLLFQTPYSLTTSGIDSVVGAFVSGANVAYEAGFDGIQLHASHGYLLSQFLSVKINRRYDGYGPPNELELLRQIISTIRAEPRIPNTFIVGVKLNAGDYAGNLVSEEYALAHVHTIAGWQNVDFLEISGGSYESPDFMGRANPRQAFFSAFSRKALECVSQAGVNRPKIMLTGSIRSVDVINDCLSRKHAELIGFGRPAILYPDLPHKVLELGEFPPISDPGVLPRWVGDILQVKLVGAGLDTAVWVRAMKRIARGDNRRLEGNALDYVDRSG
ncbi:FMN-binding oxidoreductase [Ceratobasidium theobromae]|uniref:FMN-binding oxidoreductase n=1 Tax=Ceratobasidium theobromae TaxID=1582974 RepID=A0A5N5QH44_9AGAM|nr:FMN-binding oxidoreductase [Ceratobasidium theobromae]